MDGRCKPHRYFGGTLGKLVFPEILLVSFLLFSFSFSLHIMIWRWWRPRYRILILFFLFFILPLVFLKADGIRGVPHPLEYASVFAIMLLHIALSCAYIQTYPAAEAVSPSLEILIQVHKAMPRGLSQEQILRQLNTHQLFDARIQDLVTAGLIKNSKSILEPTFLGYAIVLPFLLFRKILALPAGEG